MSEKEGAMVGLAMLAVVCLFLVALAHETPQEKPCLSHETCASVDTSTCATNTETYRATGQAADADALAPPDSAKDAGQEARNLQPEGRKHMPAMYDALTRHFPQYETARLVSLYAEVHNKVPKFLPPEIEERIGKQPSELSWADVRARAKEILGEDGFKILMAEAAPPAGVQPNTDEMVQYVLSRPPLGWWWSLRE